MSHSEDLYAASPCATTKLERPRPLNHTSLLPAEPATHDDLRGSVRGAVGCSVVSLSPPDTSRWSVDSENPFQDTYVPRHDLQAERSFSDCDDSSQQSLSACFGDDPRTGGSQPWRVPSALVRKQSMTQHSAPIMQAEGSPLRWSYSSRHERSLDRFESFLPTRRRLSVSSASLDSMNARCTTPRCSSMSTAPMSCGDSSPLSNSLRHLSSSQAARIVKCDAALVDPYVN